MKKTKIDWCDCTVNPTIGCPNGCAYCYARKINDRFHFIDDWTKPQFFPERLKEFESKKPKSIFVNSMSDIAEWKEEWLLALYNAMLDNPQHRYIALTKDIERWSMLNDDVINSTDRDCSKLSDIFFIGTTVTHNEMSSGYAADFINVEPILEEIDEDTITGETYSGNIYPIGQALIVGAETGNRKGKVVPKKEWIDKLVKFADEYKIPIFMKNSLKEIMGADFRQDRLPWMIGE